MADEFHVSVLRAKSAPGGPDGTCMEWTGRLDSGGYGVVSYKGKNRKAHRLMMQLLERLPDGLFALHRCDNRRCINPDHLFSGTLADNNRDMVSKGRLVITRGEAHPNAKLTPDAVAAIHASSLPPLEMARSLGVSPRLICRVRQGIAWSHLHPSKGADHG